MVKKEIAEIRKQLDHKRSSISRITGCYVGGEKQQIAKLSNTFLSLPEEESFKYFELLKKTLSGTLGKNLLNMDFPMDAEEEGGSQEFLMKLRASKLNDEALLDEFYERLISSFDYTGNYLILLVFAAYDVPGKTGDGLDLDDASEEVYEHIICSICPVELETSALSYDAVLGHFSAREREWVVLPPVNGFLFPAFNDRSADIHSLLYYTKKAEEINKTLLNELLGVIPTMTAGTQKESFQEILEQGLEEECSYELVRKVSEKIGTLVEENKEEPAPLILDKKEVINILSDSGASDEKLDHFEKYYDDTIGADTMLQATNIVDVGRLKVKTSNIEIKCSPTDADLLETRVIDGRRCIVIPLDNGVEINGIKVIPGKIEE